MAKQRFNDAYNHAANVETTYCHRNSIMWYQSLSELLGKCKKNKQDDWSFWVFYISTLERYAALSLKEHGNDTTKTIPEATQAVFKYVTIKMNYIQLKIILEKILKFNKNYYFPLL